MTNIQDVEVKHVLLIFHVGKGRRRIISLALGFRVLTAYNEHK